MKGIMNGVTVTYAEVENGFLPRIKIGNEKERNVPLLLDKDDIKFLDQKLEDLKGKEISKKILFEVILGAIRLSMKTKVQS